VAFSNPHSYTANPAASSTSTTVSVTTAPTTGQLMVIGCILLATVAVPSFSAPTDNGSNTGWTQVDTTQGITGDDVVAMWYRQVTATDHASLTTITLNYSLGTVSGGVAWVDMFNGFNGTPTLDLNGTPTTGTGTSATVTQSATAAASTELSYQAVGGSGTFAGSAG
jgi:hypothetical protein